MHACICLRQAQVGCWTLTTVNTMPMCECTESMQHITGQRSTSALPYTTDKRPLYNTAEHGSTGCNTDEHMLSEERLIRKQLCAAQRSRAVQSTHLSLWTMQPSVYQR